ncbi:MAG: DUF1570 domain-containing protein [Planctomycetes bacterium]|nr:DUF1570 domain-containing protein [Planctomycetota bacterium]
MRSTSRLSIAVWTILVLAPPALAQDEIGKKGKARIEIEWAKHEGSKCYSIQYEKVIPSSTVKRIAGELDDALAQYVLVFKFKPEEKLKVKFLENRNTYEQEGGKASTGGHFSPGSGYLVILQGPFYDLIPTVYHEAFHQYLHYYIGEGVSIPTWFNEGMASYYMHMQRQKGTKKLDYKLIDNRWLRMTKDKIATRSALPLEKLVTAQYEEFHDRIESGKESQFYNQSFSVIYFFMQGMGGKPVFQFADELKKTKDPSAAMEKVFGKGLKNMKPMEDRWKAYISQTKVEEKKA